MRHYKQSERVIMAFVNNYAVADIAKEAAISKPTVYRLRGDPDFMNIVSERKGEIIKATVARLRSNLTKNIDTLQSIIDDKQTSPQVRINAINVMLSQFKELAGTEELIDRIEHLEAVFYHSDTVSGGIA